MDCLLFLTDFHFHLPTIYDRIKTYTDLMCLEWSDREFGSLSFNHTTHISLSYSLNKKLKTWTNQISFSLLWKIQISQSVDSKHKNLERMSFLYDIYQQVHWRAKSKLSLFAFVYNLKLWNWNKSVGKRIGRAREGTIKYKTMTKHLC